MNGLLKKNGHSQRNYGIILAMRKLSSKALQTLINRYLQLDPKLKVNLQPLAGKHLLLEVTDLGLVIYLFFQIDRIEIQTSTLENTADLTVSGRLLALWRLFQSRSTTLSPHLREVKIIGDLHLAQAVQIFFHSIDIDWEEQLSQITGDIVAHQFFRGLRHLNQWQLAARDRFKYNLTEYLQEEVRYVPFPQEIATFTHNVDILRNDVERLAARIEQLYEFH